MWRFVVLALLALPQAAKTDAADGVVKKLLEKEGMRPGGIVRVFRFPAALPKGGTVVEGVREKGDTRKLEVKEPSYLYFVDRKAGPNFSHPVTYLLVTVAKSAISRLDGGWWPEVLDDKGVKVEKVGDRVVSGNEGNWWSDKACRVFGDDGPSIQEAQDLVKWDYMMSALPEGSDGLTLFSCPATLPAGSSIAVKDGDKATTVAKAEGESFVIFVDYKPGEAFPHAAKVIVVDRKTSKVSSTVDVQQPPRILNAKGVAIATDDAGGQMGDWHSDNAHSFLARKKFGGK